MIRWGIPPCVSAFCVPAIVRPYAYALRVVRKLSCAMHKKKAQERSVEKAMASKMKKISASCLAILSCAVVGLSACGQKGTSMVSKIQIQAYNGQEIDCTPGIYKNYLALTNPNDIAKCLFEQNNNSNLRKPVPTSQDVVVSWDRTDGSLKKYTVRVSQNEDLSNPVFQTTTENVYAVIEGILPGNYYWQVTDTMGNESVVDTFRVSNYVRALDVDKIKNFRDLGGWKTESGKTVKYGMTYRCAALRESSGKALSELGVKMEIDLRAGTEYAKSVLTQSYGIEYLQAGIMQGDYVLKDKSFYSMLTPEQIEEKRHSDATFKQEYADALYAAFKVYTQASNYPIVFHCTSGADRTGTFAFLLNGMLGVDVEDLYKDFELTCFSMGGKRWRSNIESDGNGGYFFNDDGYATVPDNYVAIGLLYKGLMTCYKTEDGKLSSAIKNYLKLDVGLSDEDFETIEKNMLE